LLYAAAWAALIAVYQPDQPAWQDVTDDLDVLLLWEPVDFRLLYGNLLAASLALAAMPMLYGFRHVTIRRHHGSQLRDLRAFAEADLEILISEVRADEQPFAEEGPRPDWYVAFPLVPEQAAWFDILGVSSFASLEEVKHAYKVLVKQNHPDRVHGMSPQFLELAERETTKLNAAYEEAMAALRERVGADSCGVQHSEYAQA
jgi:DnaJ-domain-containing protein 1